MCIYIYVQVCICISIYTYVYGFLLSSFFSETRNGLWVETAAFFLKQIQNYIAWEGGSGSPKKM